MGENEILAARFEANRGHLRAVAWRMLGSKAEAEDAVQEAWLRLSGAGADGVDNLRGWLTTTVARICLDILRTRKVRREEPADASIETIADGSSDLEQEAAIADSVGVAMLVVLETLQPAERVAFVLHDLFSVPFDDIAPIVGRSATAARQLASRARRRVQGAPQGAAADRERRREVVNAFLAAAKDGDFSALLCVLDPSVVLRADAAAVAASLARAGMGAPVLAPEIHGAEAVAATFKGRAAAARPAMVDGQPGLVFAPGGKPFSVFDFHIEDGRIMSINLTVDPERIAAMDLKF
jgi:RNA polymerase sigma-70 factor (ECF subfamily)